MASFNRRWALGIFLILIAVIGLVYFFFFRGTTNNEGTSEITPIVVEEEPTPTPEETIGKEDVQIRVLNGSGVAGEAARVKTILEDAGFTVESTDNADTTDHTQTDIQAKTDVDSAVTDEIKELLQDDYTVTSSELSEDEEVHIIIIVGTRKNAPTAAAKPTPTAGAQTTATPTATGATTPTPTP